ncbi:MAG TPA: anti-sigma factor [Solirubrobacteraceae bacterium]
MIGCEHHDSVAAYVLGALPQDEHERFAEHLAGCEACRESAAALTVAADALPLAAVQIAPPPELKGRIMTIIRTEAELLGAAEGRAQAAAAADAMAAAAGDTSAAPARRPWWRRPLLAVRPLHAAAAAVLIAVGIAAGFLLSGGENARTVQGTVLVASAPQARAALELSDKASKLMVSGMPPPPSGKVYQVWLKRPAQDPTPTTALFRVDAQGRADVEIQRGRLKGVEQVLVTAEPDGGSMAPTSDPVIAARTA